MKSKHAVWSNFLNALGQFEVLGPSSYQGTFHGPHMVMPVAIQSNNRYIIHWPWLVTAFLNSDGESIPNKFDLLHLQDIQGQGKLAGDQNGFWRPRLGPPLASGYRSEESDWLRRCKSLWGRLMAWQGDMSHNVMGSNPNARKRYFYLKLGPVWTHLSWFRPACCGWCWGIPDAWCQLGVPWKIMK